MSEVKQTRVAIILLKVAAALGCAVLLKTMPGLSMLCGFVLGLLFPDQDAKWPQAWSKRLMGWAIVALGLSVPLSHVWQISSQTFLVTLLAIFITVVVAWWLGRRLGLLPEQQALIAAGTAICGASAIAAVGHSIKAKPEQIAIALGVILFFNTLALFLFPWLGGALSLSAEQFAILAGLAIHDTSSVVGAALAFNPLVVDQAVTVKLARAVWIVPLAIIYQHLLVGAQQQDRPGARVPWFLWGFLATSLLASLLTPSVQLVALVKQGATFIFALALFLLGLSLQWRLVKQAGVTALLLGAGLWGLSTLIALFWLERFS